MLRSQATALIATLLMLICQSVNAQTASAPTYLGVLAGEGAPQQPTGVQLYGTDLGWTFTHAGQLNILFGDSWRTAHSLCDVQSQGIDKNDDSQAVLPASYPGGVPAMSVLTQASSSEFEPIVVTRDGQSLDMSTNRTPLTGFSDGSRAVVMLHSSMFLQCAAAANGCPAPLQCTRDVGQCQPALLNLTQPCNADTNEGCYTGQRCQRLDTGYCIDPTSPQPKVMNQAALEVEISVPDADAPTHYTSKRTWPTNKFYNMASRTIAKLAKDGSASDFSPGTNTLLLWGRPGFFASEGLSLPVYLLAHELPLAEADGGKLAWRPSYFAGLDAAGKPTWSAQESDAAALSLDGNVGGNTQETVAATNQMSIAWLPAPIEKWVMLYGGGGTAEGEAGPPGFIAIRFADQPWGPWSAPEVHMSEGAPDMPNTPMGPGGLLYHPDCKDTAEAKCARTDPSRPLHVLSLFCLPPQIETDSGYFYAPNIIQEYTTANAQGGLDIYWNLSAWNPYRVHLYRSSILPESSCCR
jgi:hypothetical protein